MLLQIHSEFHLLRQKHELAIFAVSYRNTILQSEMQQNVKDVAFQKTEPIKSNIS